MDKLLDHLYRVAWWDLAGVGVVNADAFAIDCGETVVLMDAGRGGPSYPFLKQNLVDLGLWERVSVCLLTHLHQDHAGGVRHLQADGVKVWGSQGAAAYQHNESVKAYFNGHVPILDRILHDGERFSIGNVSFETLSTPGHTSTCMTYLTTIDSLRCVFCGDLVMPKGTIGYSGSFDFNKDQLLDSLSCLLRFDFDALLTGHMLRASQPEGFWLVDGKQHVLDTYQAGIDGKWVIQSK